MNPNDAIRRCMERPPTIRQKPFPTVLATGVPMPACDNMGEPVRPASEPESQPSLFARPALTIRISGQIMGGKNNIIITKQGHRFPKKSWAKWRDAKVAEVRAQIPAGWEPINEPVEIAIAYVAANRLRRDMPAVLDSIFHVLERAGVVRDDTHLWVSQSSRRYDKENAGATITFQP